MSNTGVKKIVKTLGNLSIEENLENMDPNVVSNKGQGPLKLHNVQILQKVRDVVYVFVFVFLS